MQIERQRICNVFHPRKDGRNSSDKYASAPKAPSTWNQSPSTLQISASAIKSSVAPVFTVPAVPITQNGRNPAARSAAMASCNSSTRIRYSESTPITHPRAPAKATPPSSTPNYASPQNGKPATEPPRQPLLVNIEASLCRSPHIQPQQIRHQSHRWSTAHILSLEIPLSSASTVASARYQSWGPGRTPPSGDSSPTPACPPASPAASPGPSPNRSSADAHCPSDTAAPAPESLQTRPPPPATQTWHSLTLQRRPHLSRNCPPNRPLPHVLEAVEHHIHHAMSQTA